MKINVYIGYDSKQDKCEKFPDLVNPPYSVAKHSILKNYKGDKNDLFIRPIKLQDMIDGGLYWRKEDKLASTEFTYSRFLKPHLNDYKGIAIFCESDFLWQCDVRELLEYYDERYSVMCVKHDYVPKQYIKMDGHIQTVYPRKNWSSLMMFNCSHDDCKNLSPEDINTKKPKWLHRMKWTDDNSIGEIPKTYNWLEGEYDFIDNPKVIHYTNGGPWHETWGATRPAKINESKLKMSRSGGEHGNSSSIVEDGGNYRKNWVNLYGEIKNG